uniref:Uncharacterized protein n=1 Tax=Rhizobium phage IG49 TaxID=3129228 RepID=A0AAU8HYH4_9CAUD
MKTVHKIDCSHCQRFTVVPEKSVTEIRNDVVNEIAEWIKTQRSDVPANGWEFSSAILEKFVKVVQ